MAAATSAPSATAAAHPFAGPNIAQALNDHNHLKRSTDLPLFYGRKEKDSITAHHLIERIERADTITTWDNAHKITEFYMILRDKAIVSYESLEDDDVDLRDWDVTKKEFLKMYKPNFLAHTTCANVADLIQKPGKMINDYHVRVQVAYKHLTDHKPSTMVAVRLAGATPYQAKLEGMNDMAKFFKHQLFLTGLNDHLHDKILEAS
jgi:hypothetical protein